MLFQYFKCSAVNLGSQQLSATECFASIWDFFFCISSSITMFFVR